MYLSEQGIIKQKENITKILAKQEISNAILDKKLIDKIFRGAVEYCKKSEE